MAWHLPHEEQFQGEHVWILDQHFQHFFLLFPCVVVANSFWPSKFRYAYCLLGEGVRFCGVEACSQIGLFGELFCSRNSQGMAENFCTCFCMKRKSLSFAFQFFLLGGRGQPDGWKAGTYILRVDVFRCQWSHSSRSPWKTVARKAQ